MARGILANIDQAQAPKIGWADKLSLLGAQFQDISDGGDRASGIRSQRNQVVAQAAAAQQRQQMFALAKGLYPDDPVKQMAFASAPEKFLAAIAENEKSQKLGQGEALVTNGKQTAYNNKTGFEGASPFSMDAAGHATYGAARPQSYAEAEAVRNDDLLNAGRLRADATDRRGQDLGHQVGMANVGVAQGNLGMRGRELGFQEQGGAAGVLAGQGGAGGMPAAVADPLAEIAAAIRRKRGGQ